MNEYIKVEVLREPLELYEQEMSTIWNWAIPRAKKECKPHV